MIVLTEIGGGEERQHRFTKGVIRIGRVDGNDLVLGVSHISSRHAQIQFQDGGYHLSDLGSTNGSLVLRADRQILVGPKGQPNVELLTGDQLILGDIDSPVRLLVTIEPEEKTPQANTIVAAIPRRQSAEVSRRIAADVEIVQVLFHVVEVLNSGSNREEVLSRIARGALDAISDAIDSLVILRDDDDDLKVAAQAHRGEGLARQPNAKICEQVFQKGEALLFGQASPEVPASTLVNMGVGSGIAAPLWVENEVAGVLQVNCLTGRHDLSSLELDLAIALAHHAGIAIEKASLIGQLRRAEAQLREENAFLKQRTQLKMSMVAESAAMKKVIEELKRAASSDVTVLLQGETGTGKEVTAQFVHDNSRRANQLIIPVNCGALTETLLDSELFGHKKGAYTGALSDRKGVFEMASDGTVFLDEIGEMPLNLQVRLLRVLEEGKIRRVGESVERAVNMRIIAATNKDLKQLVADGGFREDLYYRLRVFPLTLPPLRDRPGDIEPLCLHFARRYADQVGRRITGVDPGFIEALAQYSFPGNVRELANEVERAVVRVDDGQPLTADLLSEEVLSSSGGEGPITPSGTTLRDLLARHERDIIIDCLQRHAGRKSAAAQELGLTRQGLAKKIDRLGIP
jgi:Nif-specific regulatory protein